jgi:two-component system OmpR family sensor kinase
VIQLRAAMAPTHQIVLVSDPASIVGQWDPDRLHQIVDNLIGNAIKYSAEGGTVTVTAHIDGQAGQATVTVADEGPGIPVTDRDLIFGAFHRTRDAAESQVAGLGLGLYICRELARAHRGTIDVGDAPGGGAAFTVKLPLAADAIAA